MSRLRVVVIGAGVSGLSAARALADGCDVTVLEASDRAGGLVHTEHTPEGLVVEHGPDSLVTSKPAGVRLVDELGLGEELLSGKSPRSFVLAESALHPLPGGLLAMSPSAGVELLRSSLFSLAGKARLLLEPLAPRAGADDESVASFFERRLGRQIVDRVVDPLLSGIYGAEARRLSMRAVLPRIADAEQRHRSIAFGLARETSAKPVARRPPVLTLRAGMGSLTDALARSLGTRVRVRVAVRAIERARGGYRVRLADGSALDADRVIVATPPWHAAAMLVSLDGELASRLGAVHASRVDAVTLAWPRRAVPHALDGSGFVVAATEGRRLRACTWVSEKWPDRAPGDVALLRAFVRDAADASDDDLIAIARAELRDLLGVEAAPQAVRVTRRDRALPRYEVGHLDRVAAVRARAAEHPGIALAGNAFDGIGIADCVASGEAAARAVLGVRGEAA